MEIQMDHIVLNLRNEAAMIDFYTRVLQLSPERLEEYREKKVPFPSVRVNPDTIIDLFPERLWASSAPGKKEGMPNLNHFCLGMDREQWQALAGRLTEHGIAVEEGPVQRWGARGNGTSIYFRDPDGNLIEAKHY